jgi:hypothetical protein
LKIVSPVEDDVDCVALIPVSEYNFCAAFLPTSAIGTTSLITPGLAAVCVP